MDNKNAWELKILCTRGDKVAESHPMKQSGDLTVRGRVIQIQFV